MKLTISPLLLAGGICISSLASATTATYQFCSTDGCRTGGSATVASDYAKTKYPIVLAHGLGGFASIGGIMQYFYGIPQNLAENGANVFVPQMASMATNELRGEQLLNQTQQILAITGAEKLNLIGHSQGSQAIRYVAAIIPGKVASVTTVGGVILGSPVADKIVAASNIPVVGGAATAVISPIVSAFFTLLDISSGKAYSNDTMAGIAANSTATMTAFNVKYPAGLPAIHCGQGASVANGIHFYSWSGTSQLTNLFDPSDIAFALTSTLIPEANDGLVGRCASHLGQVIRDDYRQNHIDEVNLLFGLVDNFSVNPVVLYRQQANRLKVAGM